MVMGGGPGIINSLLTQEVSGERVAADLLFETKDIAKQKQLSELVPELIFPMSIMGVITWRFNSKFLKRFASELYMHEVSKDRKGRLEFVEAFLASRRDLGGEEE